ncbi:MAG: radical SAM family heme chaperone HemW [Candidatus Dormibacteria bacterium]
MTHGARVEEPRKPGLLPRSLYLHVPFCVSKCPYCDFNSHVGQQHLFNSYIGALLLEVAAWGDALGHPELDTVFIGGGTPSLVPAAHIARLMDGVRQAFTLAPGAEVSMEANPQSAEAEKMGAWLQAGINRLSLGVQSLDDQALRFLERAHSAAEAKTVMAAVRGAGFASVSFDLIFAIPGLSTRRWQEVLEEALAFSPDHLSAYELTPEHGTRLGVEVEAGRTLLPDDDTRIEQYELTQDLLAAAGFSRYEVSNWARPGHRCRHNMTYWTGMPYAAAGAGAHAFTHRLQPGALTVRQWNIASPAGYIAAVRSKGDAVSGFENLDLATTASDLMMMGLRLDQGVDLDAMELRFPDLRAVLDIPLRRLTGQGLLLEEAGKVRATARGRAVLNQVVAEFLPSTPSVG